MNDDEKNKEQLINQLLQLQQRVAELEALETERKQVEVTLQQHAERLKVLHELDRAITSSLRMSDIYYAFARHATRLLPYDHLAISLRQQDTIRVAYVAGDDETLLAVGTTLSLKTSSAGQVIRQGQPLLRHNLASGTRFTEDERLAAGGIQSSLIIPLRVKGQIIGAWHIGSRQVGIYNPDDLEMAQTMADQLALAIENARLYQEIQRRVNELSALNEIGQAITSTLDLRETLSLITAHTTQLLNVAAVSVALYDESRGDLQFAAAFGEGSDFVRGKRLALGQGIVGWVAQHGEPALVPDASKDPRTFSDFDLASGFSTHSILCVPLQSKGQTIGAIEALNKKRGPFGQGDLELLSSLAAPAAIAIENARLYEQAQQEISERKRAEIELNAYRQRLEALVQERTLKLEQAMAETAAARDRVDAIVRSVADGLIVTDLAHKVVLANPAAANLLQIPLAEIVNRHISLNIKDARLHQIIQNTIDQRQSYEVDIELQTVVEQRHRVMQARTALINDQQGQPLGVVTIIQDVTRLREADRLKTELLTTAAHELRTPLTAILGFSEILLTRQLDQTRQQRFLRMINQQSTQLARIIEDLLDISRLEAGRGLELKPEQVNMAELMKEIILPFAETAVKHNITVEGLAGLPLITGDPFRLAQVGRNLLSNAIKYSPQGGTITIRGRLIPGYLEISLKDEGIGMTPEQQAHLFEPFYRADTSDTAIGGTGLGLAVCKLIIEQHGGKIWLESERGVGTTVYFTLPLPTI